MNCLVGKSAPDFNCKAVVNGDEIVDNFTLSQFRGNKYVVLFFYPKDFTFVCPTEILAFQDKLAEFDKRNVQLIGVSTDSEYSHYAWLQMPKDKGGINGVTYPLVADLAKTISINYGVLAGEMGYTMDENDNEIAIFDGDPVAYRGLYLIDLNGKIRHLLINDLPLGRNVDEALRMVDALQHNEKFGEVCPANWSEGKDAMQATQAGVSSYLASH